MEIFTHDAQYITPESTNNIKTFNARELILIPLNSDCMNHLYLLTMREHSINHIYERDYHALIKMSRVAHAFVTSDIMKADRLSVS